MHYWIQITAGRGPEECCWVVARLADYFQQTGEKMGMNIRAIHTAPGNRPDTYHSILLSIQTEHQANAFPAEWQGTVLWKGKSMFRPHHKRKNWFVSVQVLQPAAEETDNKQEIRVDRMRSSGPGGQHVNKTETAIRVTHLPSGISAIAQEERSQHLNRKLAMLRLQRLMEQRRQEAEQEFAKGCWRNHDNVERGNPCHVFSGRKFELQR